MSKKTLVLASVLVVVGILVIGSIGFLGGHQGRGRGVHTNDLS